MTLMTRPFFPCSSGGKVCEKSTEISAGSHPSNVCLHHEGSTAATGHTAGCRSGQVSAADEPGSASQYRSPRYHTCGSIIVLNAVVASEMVG